jgi:predicted RNA-binding Zn-ribbon protein involved in translation (DUF1610 family)
VVGMGESGGAAYPSMSLSWVTLIVVVVIGIFSLFSLYLGFQAYGSDHPEKANYYIIIGTVGFAAMGYMFFRTRALSSIRLEVPRVEVVTTLECPQCGLKRIREFEHGDYVFKDDEPCNRCDGKVVITRIHRREKEKAKR